MASSPMTVILFSGGWDSVYCAVRALKVHADPIACFFDYGQSYASEERLAVTRIAAHLGLRLRVRGIDSIPVDAQGIFDNRNEVLLREALKTVKPCPSIVYFGCRNPLAILDKYKDSNWQWAKRMGRQYGVRIKTPCVMMPKSMIARGVLKAGIRSDWIYSTEKS